MLLKNKKIEQMNLLMTQIQSFTNSQFQLYADDSIVAPVIM